MRDSLLTVFFAAALLFVSSAVQATGPGPIAVEDDLGHTVRLAHPARRIVSLAPHVTELLFAAGAGDFVVGAVSYSDYPPAARTIPRVGGYNRLDLEAILALRPDLVVGWASGNSPEQLERLEGLGIPVFRSEPHHLEDIPRSLEQLGTLAGTPVQGERAARVFSERLRDLRRRYQGRAPVSLFYEIWDRPLMTINGRHLISDVMALCGARNVFADVPALAARVSTEAVLAADPEAIVAGGMGMERRGWLDQWRRWPALRAVRNDALYFIPPDQIQRLGPRILDGAERLCKAVDEVRQRRNGPGAGAGTAD